MITCTVDLMYQCANISMAVYFSLAFERIVNGRPFDVSKDIIEFST